MTAAVIVFTCRLAHVGGKCLAKHVDDLWYPAIIRYCKLLWSILIICSMCFILKGDGGFEQFLIPRLVSLPVLGTPV